MDCVYTSLKVSCGHRWAFSEVAESSVILELIHGAVLGLRESGLKTWVPPGLRSLDKI